MHLSSMMRTGKGSGWHWYKDDRVQQCGIMAIITTFLNVYRVLLLSDWWHKEAREQEQGLLSQNFT